VPYRMANVPQAWSAGCVLQMVRILLGLEPDVPAGKLYVDPALPPWCPRLTLDNLRLGDRVVSLRFESNGDGSCTIDGDPPAGLEIVRGTAPWRKIDG